MEAEHARVKREREKVRAPVIALAEDLAVMTLVAALPNCVLNGVSAAGDAIVPARVSVSDPLKEESRLSEMPTPPVMRET